MAKNFKTIYDRTGDSIALEQSFFAVLEATPGTFAAPTDTDFFFTLAGGAITHEQPVNPVQHRSGRHNTDTFAEKKTTEWEIPTMINIDIGEAGGDTSQEPALRLLWKSLLGKETLTGATSAVYDSADDPSLTFSLYENGDKWAQQVPACFVQANAFTAPGDGQAQMVWSGMGADRFRVGVGASTADNNTGNTFTLDVATEAKRFPVGAQVMIIEADGLTRSADTVGGSYRGVTASDSGTGVVTLDGAVLSDADGSATTAFFLAYAEPVTPTGISNVQTGLVGSIDVDLLGGSVACVRNFNLTISNNHEPVDYCYGTDALATPYFVAGSRLTVELELEVNLNDATIEWLSDLDGFAGNDVDFILGDAATRHLKIDLPNVIFNIPSTPVPEEGSIPFTASGIGYQTALNAADEISVSYL